jgi:anti-sigma regulatory factor (Ser/Thr protein kinase)
VGAARRARDELDALGRLQGADFEITALLMSELINNSVEHAGPGAFDDILLDAWITAALVSVRVSDGGTGFTAVPPRDGASGDRHWGLQLVERLADRWGIDPAAGTTVWFELDRV